jgi:two-component system OmpR family sensor kinase
MAQEQPGAAERHLNLSIPQAPWPLPNVQGDPDLLMLAIHNLLENALKFSHPGDTLELRAFEDGADIVIEVADTGPGIPEDEQPHVWDELFRGEAGRGIPGSGLGLALVRAIAERHNGRASLRSRFGQGTVFSLRLPASRTEPVTDRSRRVSKA